MINSVLEKKREADRKYKRNNREKIRRSNAIYRQNNKEKIRICEKEYRQNNKEKIRKRQMEYYKNNPGISSITAKLRRKKASEYKISLGCQLCGYNKCGDALDFHHTDEKIKIIDVSRLRERCWDDFLSEAKKCIVVCRNCHAEIHYRLRNNII